MPESPETTAFPDLTAVVLTLDESTHITPCLTTLKWADQLLVFDSGSSDDTAKQAGEFGARVITSPFQDYAQQRNAALDCVETSWVFFVDADERSTPELESEIKSVLLNPEAKSAGWYVPRYNYIFGKRTLGGGWYPDYQLRLFRHGRVRYKNPVHEVAEVEGPVSYLSQPLIHYNYRDPAQFHQKQQAYIRYDAQLLHEKGIRPKFYTPLTQAIRHFWWRFFLLRGFQDGLHGLRLSGYLSYYEWLKYRQLQQLTG